MSTNKLKTAEMLSKFQEAGIECLSKLRDIVTPTNHERYMRTWGIQEAAKLCQTSQTTIRRHEKDGIIPSPGRDPHSNRRTYSLEDINNIREILGTRYKRPVKSDPLVLSVSNFKGGSCKTTTSSHLLQYCAIQGLKCLLIDCDPQASSTWILGGLIPDLELTIEDTIYNAAFNDPSDINRVIRKSYINSLDIIPSNMFLQDLEIALTSASNPTKRFTECIKHIEEDYDLILFDCGPNISFITLNALAASNSIIAPIPPDMYDFAAFIAYTGSLATIFTALERDLYLFKILLTRHKENKEAREVESMMRNLFGDSLLSNYIVDTIEVSKASNSYGTVYDTSTPRGSREAFQRAFISFNSVNGELLDSFKAIWLAQSKERTSLETTTFQTNKVFEESA